MIKTILVGGVCGLAGWIIGRQMLVKQVETYMDSEKGKQEMRKEFDKKYSEWVKNRKI